MSAFLEIDSVCKAYGLQRAVDDVTLNVNSGEFLAIMGSSGSGKSTLLRMLAGLEEPTSGDIRLKGVSTLGLAPEERDTPMVWQSLALFPFLNVIENVEFGLKMRGVGARERRARARSWLERMEIDRFADRPIHALSGGQRQRVALARALVTEPPILLLDEPLSALDAHLTIRMQSVLTSLQRELGITFIYVTHSHSEAFAMADRVVIMKDGRVEQIDTPKEIYKRPASRFVAEFLGGNNIFSGSIVDGALETAAIMTEDGPISLPQTSLSGVQGGSLDLIVPSDRIDLSTSPGDDVSLPCTFVGEEFIGVAVNLYFETGSGKTVTVQRPQRDLENLDLSMGAQVFANWRKVDTHVITQARS